MSDTAASSLAPLVVTGANGHLGRSLCLAGAGLRIRAVVRSERAAETLRALPEAVRPQVHVVDPRDEEALGRVAQGAEAWLHLVGILKEGGRARYEEAHEGSCERVARVAAAAGVLRIVYPSILGASPASPNRCLASKGRAEEILLAGKVPATVLRVPMVLGPEELAARALRRQATARLTFLVDGGRSLEQPIDARDLGRGVLAAAADTAGGDRVLDLAGAESLSHKALVVRTAAALGRVPPRMASVPASAVRGVARVLERLLPDPPLTEAMLGVLLHDDAVDASAARAVLGLEATPLDETLRWAFARPPENA